MLEKSIDINPNFYKSLFNMGVVYKRLGQNEKAIEYYFKSLDLNRDYHYTYLNLSAIYIEEREFYKSIERLSEGISYNPYAEVLYYNRACSYAILGMEEKAIKDIRKTLILKPSSINWVLKDKDFKELYNNKSFQEIIQKYQIENSKEK